MVKKIVGLTLMVICLLWSVTGTANSNQSGYFEAISGRYYMTPRSAWLGELIPYKYTQVFWFIEVSGVAGTEESPIGAPIKSPEDWDKLRKASLSYLIEQKLLPKSHSHSSHPREFFFPKEWNRSLQQQTSFRTGKSFTRYCKARLTIRKLGTEKENLRLPKVGTWWRETVVALPDGTGCQN